MIFCVKVKSSRKRKERVASECFAKNLSSFVSVCLTRFPFFLAVSRVEVINSEPVGGERRYEVLVHQSYKNTVPLLHKEFLWVDNNCLCPKMRHGRSYLVMGSTEVTRGREVRLVLRNGSYVRRYTPRNLARILRVRHNEMRFCRPWRRDLRFLRPEDKALNATAANATAGDASASAASTAGSSAVLLVGT